MGSASHVSRSASHRRRTQPSICCCSDDTNSDPAVGLFTTGASWLAGLQSTMPSTVQSPRLTRVSGFGDVGIPLPQDLVPIGAPPWLENALDPTRPESGQLAGRSILFLWPGSGWAVGVLGEPNTNKRYKVDGVTANFRATYACDGKTASHVLSLTSYARATRTQMHSRGCFSERQKENSRSSKSLSSQPTSVRLPLSSQTTSPQRPQHTTAARSRYCP